MIRRQLFKRWILQLIFLLLHWIAIYAVSSVIHLLKNRGQYVLITGICQSKAWWWFWRTCYFLCLTFNWKVSCSNTVKKMLPWNSLVNTVHLLSSALYLSFFVNHKRFSFWLFQSRYFVLKVLHNYLNLGFHVGSSPYLASFITLDILLMIFVTVLQ